MIFRYSAAIPKELAYFQQQQRPLVDPRSASMRALRLEQLEELLRGHGEYLQEREFSRLLSREIFVNMLFLKDQYYNYYNMNTAFIEIGSFSRLAVDETKSLGKIGI
jgi:hypothetical protein